MRRMGQQTWDEMQDQYFGKTVAEKERIIA